MINRVALLWASGHLSGLLGAHERQAIIDSVFSRQRPDGGWSLTSRGRWKRGDGTRPDIESDGYATGAMPRPRTQSSR